MKDVMLAFIACTWELPQTLVAMLVMFALAIDNEQMEIAGCKDVVIIQHKRGLFNITLGRFIFLGNKKRVLHEYGHSVQSLILGWLYLVVVVLPIFIHQVLCEFGVLSWKDYHKRYPETWADNLGGVKR